MCAPVSVFSLGWVKKNDTDITKQAPCFQTRQYAVILLYHKSVFNDYAFTVQFDSILSNFSIAHTKLSDSVKETESGKLVSGTGKMRTKNEHHPIPRSI